MAIINVHTTMLGIGRYRIPVGGAVPDAELLEQEKKTLQLFLDRGFLVDKGSVSKKVVEPKVVEPKVVEPKVVEPKVVEPKVVEQEVVEQEVVEPKVVEQEVVEQEVVEPKPTKRTRRKSMKSK